MLLRVWHCVLNVSWWCIAVVADACLCDTFLTFAHSMLAVERAI